MTPEVKRAHDRVMEFYDKVLSRISDGLDVGADNVAVLMFTECAHDYAAELYCPSRKPAVLADKDASDYAIAQCHDLVAMMRTWKPAYA